MIRKSVMPALLFLVVGGLSLLLWLKWEPERENIISVEQPGKPSVTPKSANTPIDIITAGTAGEDLGRAIEAADKIARQHGSLTDAESARLLDYICAPRPDQLTDGDWQHLVNSALNALRTNPSAVTGSRLSSSLAALATDHTDPVIRLYALQHISFWYPQETDPARKQELATLLRSLSAGSEEAGTATMVMSYLQRHGQLEQTPRQDAAIERAALRLVTDRSSSTEVRVTALHTLTDRRTPEALPEARRISEDRTEHIILRKAAIFAIGRLGNPADDSDRLKGLSKEHHRLAQAAKPALEHLSK